MILFSGRFGVGGNDFDEAILSPKIGLPWIIRLNDAIEMRLPIK